MTGIRGPAREAKPIILRRLCEQFTKPFDYMEVYKSQGQADDLLTADEIAKLLPLADYLEVVAPAEHNRRALYRFKDDERLPRQVGLAAGPRRCGKCGRDIHRGSHGGTHKRQVIDAGKNDRCQYCHREVSRSGKHKHEAACARRRSA